MTPGKTSSIELEKSLKRGLGEGKKTKRHRGADRGGKRSQEEL